MKSSQFSRFLGYFWTISALVCRLVAWAKPPKLHFLTLCHLLDIE